MTESASWDVASGVGSTALTIAAMRAIEAQRPDALARDPYAEAFVLASGMSLPTTPEAADADPAFPWPAFSAFMGLRCRFFDDYFGAAGDDGIRQVVILGAGLDARAFRLDWPSGTTLYELDVPRVLGFKDQVLESLDATARCARQAVPADLRAQWSPALLAAGFNPGRQTAWLAEGLLPYLGEEGRLRLLAALSGLSADGSRVMIDYPTQDSSSMRGFTALQDIADRAGVAFSAADTWADDTRDDPAGWLAAHGWLVGVRPVRAVAEQYGRAISAALPATLRSLAMIAARAR